MGDKGGRGGVTDLLDDDSLGAPSLAWSCRSKMESSACSLSVLPPYTRSSPVSLTKASLTTGPPGEREDNPTPIGPDSREGGLALDLGGTSRVVGGAGVELSLLVRLPLTRIRSLAP